MQLRYSRRVHKAVQKASVVISASSESQKSLKKYFHIDSPLLNETGCYPKTTIINSTKEKDDLNLLWVGKLDFRKQLSLALKTIAQLANPQIKLHIIGGNNNSYQKLAMELNISHQCIWHGVIPHHEVQGLMRKADVFFFTSIAEGTPHVVLEAISNNLPVICFDVCGHGDSVNEQVGVKVPLSTPQQSINDFAEKITYLFNHRDVLKRMSENCKARQEELSWDNKAKQMISLYKKVLSQ